VSNCFADNPLLFASDDIRIVFAAFVIRIGLLSFDVDNRLKNDDESGDKLVPVEFGGVRCCCLLKLSSV
jgi:hypothetical protein